MGRLAEGGRLSQRKTLPNDIGGAGLAFVRSGGVDINTGSTNLVGFGGYGWSRTASTSAWAYYLYFYPTGVGPSDYGVRYYGRSLRCLYPGK